MISFEVRSNELVADLTRQAAEHGIRNAAIVSLIGALDSFTLSTMPADDATKDVLTSYDFPAEMSGTGEIVDGVIHVHAVRTFFTSSRRPSGPLAPPTRRPGLRSR
jgi:predicted DNA-binding protein with PD1-like motif